ncbi:hypothetical protein P152DRAFT_472828 [Eremomyces bilateralis CBS 781.70]|uniref:Carrier domain-containing protein n=1 Tax=Eremomyces bilateralis CBS 781.70 TaxID=1392243 RepID=A0A6G1G7M2_9PEZI|nr:uncharacterized protein P152DRAFT_472828 [Eremomyces bilateralis CBS 781.70]KAF1814058.1 hypothetical protein P152DRAFT_472828 [Eremomyces bilateralis CBS 781.70]
MVDRLRRFRQLRDDVRDHLKTKLPVYAVPTVIVPLYRMPLNPNGKIDRPALPFPEPHELAHSMPRRTSHTTAAMSTTERTLGKIWSQALRTPVNVIGPESDFADLGGHSNLGQQMLWRFPTLRGLAGEIDRALDLQNSTASTSVIIIIIISRPPVQRDSIAHTLGRTDLLR